MRHSSDEDDQFFVRSKNNLSFTRACYAEVNYYSSVKLFREVLMSNWISGLNLKSLDNLAQYY